jgi:outer membrane protein assembly factor BamE (lipoprotein component of BamABCDE complex)
MKFNLKPQTSRWLLAAGLMFGVAAAQAAGGFTVNHDQENSIKVGMTTTEVQQALGRPARNVKYGNEPGPTWAYNVVGTAEPMTVFEVDFSSDGKVASVDERTLSEYSGGGSDSN